jgi:hypothetical protein
MSDLSYTLATSWPLWLLGALTAIVMALLLHGAFILLALWFAGWTLVGLWCFARLAPRPTPIQRATGRR